MCASAPVAVRTTAVGMGGGHSSPLSFDTPAPHLLVLVVPGVQGTPAGEYETGADIMTSAERQAIRDAQAAKKHNAGTFSRGANPGTGVCWSCGKRAQQQILRQNCDMCRDCYYEAGLENEHNDGYHADEPNTDCALCKSGAPGPEPLAEGEEPVIIFAGTGGLTSLSFDDLGEHAALAKRLMLEDNRNATICTLLEVIARATGMLKAMNSNS